MDNNKGVKRETGKGHESNPGIAIRRSENVCQPTSKSVPFSNIGRIRRGDGLRLSYSLPAFSETPTPTAPTSSRPWETFVCFTKQLHVRQTLTFQIYHIWIACDLFRLPEHNNDTNTMIQKVSLNDDARHLAS